MVTVISHGVHKNICQSYVIFTLRCHCEEHIRFAQGKLRDEAIRISKSPLVPLEIHPPGPLPLPKEGGGIGRGASAPLKNSPVNIQRLPFVKSLP